MLNNNYLYLTEEWILAISVGCWKFRKKLFRADTFSTDLCFNPLGSAPRE